MTEVVKITDVGHVRTITLNRPERKNALSDELAWGVVAAVEEAATVDDVWVIAITGSGDSFCAGLDLTGAARSSPLSRQSAQLDDVGWVGNFLLAIRKRCDKPVVGGINGVAVGAGLGLAMATDVRLISKSARLMAGYTRIGGSPDAGLTITLPQAMGYEQAMRFMMENRTVLGEEAVALGMAGEVVDDAAFEARLAAYCQQLCAWSPITLRLLKRGITKSYETNDMEQQLRYEVSNIRMAFGSDDAKEARKAFFESASRCLRGSEASLRPQQRHQPGAGLAVGHAVDLGGLPMPLEGADDGRRGAVEGPAGGAVIAQPAQARLQGEDAGALLALRQRRSRRRRRLGPEAMAGLGELFPREQLARILLAARGHVGVTEDAGVGDRPALADIRHQFDHRAHLNIGERPVAELVAGVDDLDADRATVDVALALPERLAGVPGAARLRHEGEDAAVLLDHIVGRDPGRRIAQPRQRRLAGRHAGIVEQDHVGRPDAGVEVGRRRVDEAHAGSAGVRAARMAR